MKILIVEDEPEARDGLFRLLSGATPDWLVLPPCADGAAGLATAMERHPDIVITDIRMPLQDGLGMIESLRHQSNRAAVIVLSGYPEFEYARRCLGLGVRDYLLKPVTAARLVEAVQAAAAELFNCGDLARFLDGGDTAEPAGWEADYGAGVLVLVRSVGFLGPEKLKSAKDEVRGLLGPRCRVLSAAAGRECWFFLEAAALERLPAGAAGFGRNLSRRLHATVTVCGRPAVFAAVPETMNLLRQDSQNFLLGGADDFLAAGLVLPEAPTRQEYNLDFEIRFAEAARDGGQAVGEVFSSFLQETFRPGFEPSAAVRLGQRFLFAVQNYMKELGPGRFRELLSLNPVERLKTAICLDEVRGLFRECADLCAGDAEADGRPAVNPRIQAAVAIVDDRVPDPPSLAILAEELRMNSGYLSRLFKQEVGEGYSRYVMRQRIKFAATLLANRKLTINAVAERCGFRNAKYFFEVFKKETGQTPSEYRARML